MSSKPYQPQQDVADLMKLYEQDVLGTPTVSARKILLLRARLLFEEALEFVVAAGCSVELCGDASILDKDTMRVYIDPALEPDLVEMADAIGDTLVVTYGAANALGIQVQPVWDEIHRSNLSKVHPDGTVHKRADGKVIKPSTYSPANLAPVLALQTNTVLA